METVPPPTPTRPRIYPSLLVAFGILPAFLLVSIVVGVAMVVFAMATGQVGRDGIEDWWKDVVVTLPGILAVTIPGQALLIATGIGAARMSRTPWRERLAWRSPGLGPESWILLVLGSLGVLGSMQLVGERLIEEPSEQLKLLARVLTEARGASAVVVAVLFSVLPGFAEELLFRGFVQTGLARRWPAWAAIGMSAFAFAALHLDLQHSSLVLPLGVWFGFVAWATRSVVAAMFAHALNNLVAIVIGQHFGDAEWSEIAPPSVVYGAVAFFGVCTLLCIAHLLHRRRREPSAEGAEHEASGTG